MPTVTPVIRGVGAPVAGTGAISPGLPAGTIAGDFLVMFLETADQAITVDGWTELPTDSPQSVAGLTRLTIFTRIAVGGVGGDPTLTSDSGDHQLGRIIGIQAGTYDTAAPIDSSAGGTRSVAGTTATIPGPTTTQGQCLVLAASSHDLDTTAAAFSGWANANLASVTERIDNGTTDGNGGGIGVASGEKVAAGAVGNTTATVTSSVGGMISLAIAPHQALNVRISQVPVEVVAANVPVPPPRVSWRTGIITTPGSPGSGSVSNLDGKPKAVIFFGTNWTTEDSVVTSTGLGMFRGMVGPAYDDPNTLIQSAASIAPPGDAHRIDNYAILQIDTAGSAAVLYRATVDSLDDQGFSYTFDVAAAGYKVIFLALMDDDTELRIGSRTDAGLDTTFPLGFRAGASLYHGAWAGLVNSGTDRTQEFYGGGAYPPGNSEAAWLTAFCFPTSASGQAYNEINANQDPAVLAATGGHFVGPFLNISNLHFLPTGTYSESFRMDGDSADSGMVIAWDDADSTTGFLTPSALAGGTATVSGVPFEPGLVIGYTLSRVTLGSTTGGHGAAGFYVATDDFQWCAVVDGETPRGGFQSFQRGFCDAVSGSGVHAGTIELTEDGFVTTTVDDDITQRGTTWQLFGHPRRAPWKPHIYRLVLP